jgi:hypothetical protein
LAVYGDKSKSGGWVMLGTRSGAAYPVLVARLNYHLRDPKAAMDMAGYEANAHVSSRPVSTFCSAKSVPGNTRFCRRGDRHSERRRDTPVSGRSRYCPPCCQPHAAQLPLLYNHARRTAKLCGGRNFRNWPKTPNFRTCSNSSGSQRRSRHAGGLACFSLRIACRTG